MDAKDTYSNSSTAAIKKRFFIGTKYIFVNRTVIIFYKNNANESSGGCLETSQAYCQNRTEFFFYGGGFMVSRVLAYTSMTTL